jgi:hypothetical protein
MPRGRLHGRVIVLRRSWRLGKGEAREIEPESRTERYEGKKDPDPENCRHV